MKPQAWARILELLAVMALGLGGWAMVSVLRPGNSSHRPVAVATAPTPIASPDPASPTAIAWPTATPYPPNYPIDKQTLEAKRQQTRMAVTIVPRTGTPYFNPPTPDSQPSPLPWDWGTGILHEGDGPFSAMEFLIYNQWYGMVNGNRVQVYAGGIKDNPGVSQDASQGVVIVVISTPSQDYPPAIYRTPTKAGPLRVLEAQGARLRLASPDTTAIFFDVPARQFVASFTAPVLAATPAATPMVPTGYP